MVPNPGRNEPARKSLPVTESLRPVADAEFRTAEQLERDATIPRYRSVTGESGRETRESVAHVPKRWEAGEACSVGDCLMVLLFRIAAEASARDGTE